MATISIPGCDADPGQGSLWVRIYGEELIEDSIPAEVVVDGWSIDFTKFLVVVDGIAIDGMPVGGRYVFALSRPSGGEGHPVVVEMVAAGTVEHLDYRIGPGTDAVAGNVGPADVDAANEDGWSIFVEGTAIRDDQTKAFSWSFDTDTTYFDCQTGQVVPDDGEATSQITIHADHLFYDDLESPEPDIAFDLVASADADADGVVTAEELRGVDITAHERYQVGSRDIDDLWTFIQAQTATLGHIDGEGHCETRVE